MIDHHRIIQVVSLFNEQVPNNLFTRNMADSFRNLVETIGISHFFQKKCVIVSAQFHNGLGSSFIKIALLNS